MRGGAGLVVGVGFVLSLAGCAEKNRDAIEKMKPEYAALRARLAKVGQSIAAMGPARPEKVAPSPPPTFDEKTKQFNTEILALEQLTDATVKPPFDLSESSNLKLGLEWTGDHSPLSESALEMRKGKETEAELRDALQYRYVVVYRTIGLVEPKVIDDKTFTPGQVALALYLVDLAGGDKIQLVGIATGRSADATSYLYRKGDDQKEALARFAHSSMWEAVRPDICAKLDAGTGGHFVFSM